MRPVSGNGRRSFFAETFLLPNPYNANKLPDLYLVILSQPVLEIHMISCYPAAPQGRKRKGEVCAVLECGGSWELGGILLPFCSFRTAAIFFRVLLVPARYLPYTFCPFSCLVRKAVPASFSCLTL